MTVPYRAALLAGHLRDRETMIDEETERAVAGWVWLGDQLTGRDRASDATSCSSCGSTFRVLGHGRNALCARCYLERGDATGDDAA